LISELNKISASVIQCSALELAAFIVTASDLTTTVPGNKMKKYVDDCYLIIPASSSSSIPSELLHLGDWTLEYNFRLNASKTSEIVFYRLNSSSRIPPPTPGITRVTTLKVLGILLTDNLKMTAHVSATIVDFFPASSTSITPH